MKKKRIAPILLCFFVLVFPGTMLFAQPYDMGDAQGDLESIAQGLSDIFGPNLGSMSFLGDPVGYSTVPHFAIGAAGGMVLVPTANVGEGSNMEYDFGEIAYIPIPAIAAHAKLKIQKLEFGLKVGGIPALESEDAGASINNLIAGGKVRYDIFSKKHILFKIGASAGAFYEYTSGSISMIGRNTIPIYLDIGGIETHAADFTTETGFETTWTGHTVGGEAQANLQILFFNFFGGSRLSKTFGGATTDLVGSATLEALPGFETDVTGGTQSITISAEAEPEGIDIHLFGGVEVKLLIFALTARGGYNFTNENIMADFGARLQF